MSSKVAEAAGSLASAWLEQLAQLADAAAEPASHAMPQEDSLLAVPALAEFISRVIGSNQSAVIVVPNDEMLPELSNALDLELRPLCLVLPAPDFAARITLRATLALLNSRLARGGEARYAAAWETQRQRIEQQAESWRNALAWSKSCGFADSDANAWPDGIENLFPVCILSLAQARKLHPRTSDTAPFEMSLLLQPEHMMNAMPLLLTQGKHTLLMYGAGGPPNYNITTLDADAYLRAEFEVLAQQLGEMELELATAQAELAEFTQRYYDRIGSRIAELDTLLAQIAQLRADLVPTDAEIKQTAQEAEERAQQSQRERARYAELNRETEKPFAPSGDLKRLYRKLAQKIHPDRATDESDRAWRTQLMTEANRAYRNSDEMVLKDILHQWRDGQQDEQRESKQAQPVTEKTGNAPLYLEKQVARMKLRLSEIEKELNRLFASRLYELFAASNLADARGRNLLQEMADNLDMQIAAAKQQLSGLKGS